MESASLGDSLRAPHAQASIDVHKGLGLQGQGFGLACDLHRVPLLGLHVPCIAYNVLTVQGGPGHEAFNLQRGAVGGDFPLNGIVIPHMLKTFRGCHMCGRLAQCLGGVPPSH